MEVADALSAPIPRDLYARLYEAGDPHVSIFAVRKQLTDGHADGFFNYIGQLNQRIRYLETAHMQFLMRS